LCPPLISLFCAALQLLLLENVRFYKEEEKNDAEFAKKVISHIQAFCTLGD
jgi:3-phosphoglycerate kinase